jgi:hypothetical protein
MMSRWNSSIGFKGKEVTVYTKRLFEEDKKIRFDRAHCYIGGQVKNLWSRW